MEHLVKTKQILREYIFNLVIEFNTYVFEIFCFHNKFVAFPISYRVSQPFSVGGIRMLRVDSNNTSIVNHLLENHDVIIGLHDPLIIIVKAWERWDRGGKADQTSF